ncbi:MAG: response regulator transcription factor [Bacteroidota bacterium]
MTFLIAEDNLQMRQSIKRFLLKSVPNHHTFYEASDGSEAVKQYDRFSPDWVVMDIEMLPMDGLTASKKILGSHPTAKIIVLTSYDDAGYRKAAYDAGTFAFVSKEHLDDLKKILSTQYKGQ